MWWLPGLGATLSLVMINAVRWDDLETARLCGEGLQLSLPHPRPQADEEDATRYRLWLLLSYLASFGSVGGGIAGLAAHFSKHGHDEGVGAALVAQTVLITAAALLFWCTRSTDT